MFKDIKAFLSSVWSKMRQKGVIKRNAWIITVVLLTIFIPLTIAVCYFQFVYTGPKEQSPTISVELFAPDGTVADSSESTLDTIDSAPLVKTFYDLSASKVSTSRPQAFLKPQNLIFTVTINSKKSTYKCYFEESLENSYFEDETGAFFIPDATAYSSFLASTYSEAVYPESTPPSLSASKNDAITPSSVDWSYLLTDGTVEKTKNYKATNEISTYRITGAIAFEFSREPSKCNFEVKRSNGDIVFSGPPEGLPTLTASDGEELSVFAEAEWVGDSVHKSYGKQTYEFKIICTEPSSFILNSTTLSGGDFLFITVTDVYSIDSILYEVTDTSTLEKKGLEENAINALKSLYSYEPTFVKDGRNAYAFFPIPADIPSTEFKFSLSCGISKESFSLPIKSASPWRVNLPTTDPAPKIAITDEQKTEFSSILSSLKEKSSSRVYFRNGFLSPLQYGFEQSLSFNSDVIYGEDSLSFLASSYSTNEIGGASVKSAAIGRVCASGRSELLGNYVIVDHGIGLHSWYCGLSDVNVGVGDIVKQGSTIGKSGSSSLLCEDGVNVLCSINGSLVNPHRLFEFSFTE